MFFMGKQAVVDNPVKISGVTNSWLLADLTEEERELLRRKESGVITTGNLGFFEPSKILKYFSHKFNQIFEGSPDLRIHIDFPSSVGGNLAGTYYFVHGDIKDNDKSDLILSGPILVSDLDGNRISPDYVIEDNSGRIIPITRERIEQEIRNCYEGIDGNHNYQITKPERLAKLVGLDYSAEIEQLRQYAEKKRIERYSSRENLEGVLGQLEEALGYGGGGFFDEMSELPETTSRFLEIVPKISLLDDLNQRAVQFLNEYAKLYDDQIQEAEEEFNQAHENLEGIKGEKQYILGLANQLRTKK